MTKAQLIKALEDYPDNMDVFIDERVTEFTYGLLNGVYKKQIDFYENPDEPEPLSSDEVIILSEE